MVWAGPPTAPLLGVGPSRGGGGSAGCQAGVGGEMKYCVKKKRDVHGLQILTSFFFFASEPLKAQWWRFLKCKCGPQFPQIN